MHRLVRRLAARRKRGELALRLPQATTYGASAEEAQRFGLPCGGTVQIVLEPLSAQSLLRELDAHSALVAVTHDPKLDDLALMEALKSPAFYVGALGSRRNNDTRRDRLRLFEVSADEVQRLRGPVGLNLGGLADWSGSLTACKTNAKGALGGLRPGGVPQARERVTQPVSARTGFRLSRGQSQRHPAGPRSATWGSR